MTANSRRSRQGVTTPGNVSKNQFLIRQQSSGTITTQLSPSQSVSSFTSSKIGLPNQSSRQPAIPKEIVIVSKGTDGDNDVKFTFPPPFKPLIPIGYESLPPGAPQINPRLLLNIGQLLQYQLYSKAEFISRQQIILCDTIRDIESQATFLAGALLAERSRRFNKVAENFSKLGEMDSLICKIENEASTCIARIKLINSSLPSHLQLEPFNFPTD